MIIARSTTLTKESAERPMARIRLWSLREDVLVEADPDIGRVVVINRWGETRIDDADEIVRESLRRMSLGPISLDNVLPPENPGPSTTDERRAEWDRLGRALDVLSGSVVHSLGMYDGEGPLFSAVPGLRSAMFTLAGNRTAQPLPA